MLRPPLSSFVVRRRGLVHPSGQCQASFETNGPVGKSLANTSEGPSNPSKHGKGPSRVEPCAE